MKRTNLPTELQDVKSAMSEIMGRNDFNIIFRQNKKRINTPGYVLIFKYANEQIRQSITFRAHTLLSHIYYILTESNKIPLDAANLAKSWGYTKWNLDKALAELRRHNLLIKMGGSWCVSPEIAWCGWLKEWKAVCDNIAEADRVTLPISRRKHMQRKEEIIPIDRLKVGISEFNSHKT